MENPTPNLQVSGEYNSYGRSLMGNDICSGVSFKSAYFDFFSTYVGSSVIKNGRNLYF
jgi:hypothetical protein